MRLRKAVRDVGELDGKVAVVTGAGSGIGRASVERLAKAGARVVVSYLDHEDDARALADSVSGLAVRTDVASAPEVQSLFETVGQELGRVDVLVNNAGITRGGTPFIESGLQDLYDVLGVNLVGAFTCAQHAARMMIEQGEGGSIVNVSSVHEDVPLPTAAMYCASKGAVRMLMRCLAVELAPQRIRVNNVAPGPVRTALTDALRHDPERMDVLRRTLPMARLADPAEIAEVVSFLACGTASFVTGSTYYADGGLAVHTHPI